MDSFSRICKRVNGISSEKLDDLWSVVNAKPSTPSMNLKIGQKQISEISNIVITSNAIPKGIYERTNVNITNIGNRATYESAKFRVSLRP